MIEHTPKIAQIIIPRNRLFSNETNGTVETCEFFESVKKETPMNFKNLEVHKNHQHYLGKDELISPFEIFTPEMK
jgi:hypothetical protein